MINSEKQFKASKEKLTGLRKTLDNSSHSEINPILARSAKIQVQALIQEIEKEISLYENLKKNGVSAIKLNNISDILNLPIMYRIAKGMSQEQFARFVDISLRQIVRYESEGYENINGENLKKILSKIDLKLALAEKASGE